MDTPSGSKHTMALQWGWEMESSFADTYIPKPPSLWTPSEVSPTLGDSAGSHAMEHHRNLN